MTNTTNPMVGDARRAFAATVAAWLRGDAATVAGHAAPPDPETALITEPLTALCDAGVPTVQSQPGGQWRDADGTVWQQRAALTALWRPDRPLPVFPAGTLTLARSVWPSWRSARRESAAGIAVTRCTSTARHTEIVTEFGPRLTRRAVRRDWGDDANAVLAALSSTHVTIACPTWGDPAGGWWRQIVAALTQ